jgi:hypothetical protein
MIQSMRTILALELANNNVQQTHDNIAIGRPLRFFEMLLPRPSGRRLRLTRHRACVYSGHQYLRPLSYFLYLQTAPSWVWSGAPQK